MTAHHIVNTLGDIAAILGADVTTSAHIIAHNTIHWDTRVLIYSFKYVYGGLDAGGGFHLLVFLEFPADSNEF